MNASDVIPVLLVRNEERFIRRVLTPLVTVFPHILLADTGSNDDTLAIVREFPSVYVIEKGLTPQHLLTDVRQELGDRAAQRGVHWQLLVDGDELYSVTTLQHMLSVELPAQAQTGFTTMLTLDEDDETNQIWELDNLFNRQALLRAGCRWTGVYPFDAPDSFADERGFFYFPLPAGYRFHALHLHPLTRSRKDGETLLRTYKKKKFSLQDKTIPRTVPFDLDAWCSQ